MLLEGKRAIVTGGLTGVGRATVLAFAKEGAKVVSISRQPVTSDAAVKMLTEAEALGAESVVHMKLDVSIQGHVNSVFDEAAARMGGLDVLVNCAGIEQQKPAEDLTADDLYATFAANVEGTAFACAAAFRYMKDAGGSIINYSSNAGIAGTAGMASYSASKGAIAAYSRTLALEWSKYWIRTNIVCPVVMTEMAQAWYDAMTPDLRAQMEAWLAASIPLGGKMGTPGDAADLNVFLASDRSRFINGQTLSVDGGLMMVR